MKPSILLLFFLQNILQKHFIEDSEDINENIQKCSQETQCQDKNSRVWPEIFGISICKIKKISKYIPENYQIYYYRTAYKTTGCNEIAKISFTMVDLSPEDHFEDEKRKPKFLSVCVPVSRQGSAWIEDRCPFDDCVEFSRKQKCQYSAQYEDHYID